ncbi:MAG TPA: hypothetical protein PKY82_29495 [Pyrinomonadaceae bacterium]|nr:hypothetical protein [Pyrinomonadaceae bacterium]
MPLNITKTSGGLTHSPVFVGQILGTDVVKIDISDLSDKEVDENGYLKPGVPFMKDGNPVGSSGVVWGVTIEPIKIATGNTDTILDAATDCFVTVGFGLVNRDIAEDNLGRAYTSDEIAGFDLAGSNCRITRT